MSDSRDDTIAQQKAEQEYRKNQEDAYDRQNKAIAKWVEDKIKREQNLSYEFGVPKPLPKEPDPDALAVESINPNLPEKLVQYGIYPVTITNDNALIFKKTQVDIIYDSKGVRPAHDTPEGRRASVAFCAQVLLAEKVELNVPEDPHFPNKSLDRLKDWAKECVKLGVEAELSGSANAFLAQRNKTLGEKIAQKIGFQYEASEIKEIKNLIALSSYALAEARVERGSQWIAEEKGKVETATTKRNVEWNNLDTKLNNIDANTTTEAITTMVENMVKELESARDNVENLQKRYEELQKSEEMILKDPEAIVAVHEEKKDGKVKDRDEAIALVKDDQPTKDKVGALLTALEAARVDVATKNEALRAKVDQIKAARPDDEKKKALTKAMEKSNVSERLHKLDLAVGKAADPNVPSTIKSKNEGFRDYNTNLRQQKIHVANNPPPRVTP